MNVSLLLNISPEQRRQDTANTQDLFASLPRDHRLPVNDDVLIAVSRALVHTGDVDGQFDSLYADDCYARNVQVDVLDDESYDAVAQILAEDPALAALWAAARTCPVALHFTYDYTNKQGQCRLGYIANLRYYIDIPTNDLQNILALIGMKPRASLSGTYDIAAMLDGVQRANRDYIHDDSRRVVRTHTQQIHNIAMRARRYGVRYLDGIEWRHTNAACA